MTFEADASNRLAIGSSTIGEDVRSSKIAGTRTAAVVERNFTEHRRPLASVSGRQRLVVPKSWHGVTEYGWDIPYKGIIFIALQVRWHGIWHGIWHEHWLGG